MRIYDYRCADCRRHYSYDHDNNKPPVCTTPGCPGHVDVEKFAFQCNNCKRLMHAVDAGENKTPNCCNVCGAGIHIGFDAAAFHREMEALIPKGKKLDDGEVKSLSAKLHDRIKALPTTRVVFEKNWTILADCTDEELKEAGLDRQRVERHVPLPPQPVEDPKVIREPQNMFVEAHEGVSGVDKVLGKNG